MRDDEGVWLTGCPECGMNNDQCDCDFGDEYDDLPLHPVELGVRPHEMVVIATGCGHSEIARAWCDHTYKFEHAAHYGHWDLYKCTKCGEEKIEYWRNF